MKYCAHCGSALQDTDAFCTNCGASSVEKADSGFATAYRPEAGFNPADTQSTPLNATDFIDPVVAAENKKNATKALVFGILSLVLCYIPILNIIFAILAKGTGKKVLANNPTGVAKVFARIGNILGIVGLALSIFYTVFWELYILYIVFILFIAMLPALF